MTVFPMLDGVPAEELAGLQKVAAAGKQCPGVAARRAIRSEVGHLEGCQEVAKRRQHSAPNVRERCGSGYPFHVMQGGAPARRIASTHPSAGSQSPGSGSDEGSDAARCRNKSLISNDSSQRPAVMKSK